MDWAQAYFKNNSLQKPFLRFTMASIASTVGIYAANQALNLQLDHIHMIASTAFTLLFKYCWQAFFPSAKSGSTLKGQVEGDKSASIALRSPGKKGAGEADASAVDESSGRSHSGGSNTARTSSGTAQTGEAGKNEFEEFDPADASDNHDNDAILDDDPESDGILQQDNASVDLSSADLQSSTGFGSYLKTNNLNEHARGLEAFG